MELMLIAVAAAAALYLARVFARKYRSRYMPPEPAKLRTDLEFWYYGIQPGELAEIADHVTMIHESMWFGGVDAAIESMRAHGMRTVLTVQGQLVDGAALRGDAEHRLRDVLRALDDAGVLQQVVALYPVDEPDALGCTEQDVMKACGIVRSVAGEFKALDGVKLAVTYSYKRTLVGIEAFDWIGLDDYGLGSGVLISDAWRELLDRLKPHQRCYVVPGGANPWKQHPEAFRRWAHSEPKCMGIMAFMWGRRDDSGEVNDGIGANGMSDVYRALGAETKALRGTRAIAGTDQ